MNINYQDYEAIAALEHGTLEDWAFESVERFTDMAADINMLISGHVAQDAIYKNGSNYRLTHPTTFIG